MKPIIIQGAEEHETNFYEEKLTNKEIINIGGFTFIKGWFEDKEIVVSRTKVGEINSSSATTIAILKFTPKAIINQGTAGAHDRNIHKGELVVGEKYFYLNAYRSDYRAEGEGVDIANWNLKESFSENYNKHDKIKFGSLELVEQLKNNMKTITDRKVNFGVIGSGDIWNKEVDRILFFNKNYGTLCEEMEVAGVYKIANSFGIPAVSIRIISNNEILQEEYDPNLALECQKIIYELILKNKLG